VQQIRAQIEQHQKQIDVLRQQRRNYEDTLRFALRNLKIADEEFRRDKALVGKGMISARERDQRQQSHNEVEQVVQTARNDLALIGPRIQEIQAAIAAAQAQLADAELKLDKTRLLAPFNGQVINSNLEVGEFVQAGNEVATLYDTAAVEIPIALSPDLLRWLPDFVFNTHHYDSQNVAQYRPHVDSDAPPGVLRSPVRTPRTPLENNGAEPLRQSLAIRVQSTRVALPDERREDSHDAVPHPLQWPPATVHWRSGNREYTWQGRVVRSEAGLDEKTRTMKLVVEVQEPRKIVRPGQPPLQPGMFCQVEIDAGSVSDAVVIPRTALHEANTVFLVHDGILTRRPVQVLRELRDQAIITAGLQPGDKLIVYPLTTPIEGMKLRPLEIEAPTPPATPASSRPDRGAAEPRVTGHTKRKS
jgi:multidrug efflux pump subunit AcrA (membrane-fusion protein)